MNNHPDNRHRSRWGAGRRHVSGSGGGGHRIQPHDRVDEDDVELIKPRPDRTRTRRPIKNIHSQNFAHTNFIFTTNISKIFLSIIMTRILIVNLLYYDAKDVCKLRRS